MSGCYHQAIEAQKLQRCVLQENTKTKQKTVISGPDSVLSEIGISPKEEKKGVKRQRRKRSEYSFALNLVSFCAVFLFASSLTNVSIASFNLHGFKASSNYLKSCIDKHGGIWMTQELWLTEQQLPLLHQTGAQFCARSGMQDSISTKMYQGRPHGGVCIAWSPNLNHLVFPLANFRHKRVVGAELRTEEDNYLLLCAYMPFFNASNRAECMADTIDAISMLESIIEEFQSHKIILGGDLNTELKGNSPFDPLWNDFTSRYGLAYCDSLFPTDSITYQHESLGQSKWNDHFIVSSCLLGNNLIVDQSILDEGENTSDHYPVTIKVSMKLKKSSTTEFVKPAAPSLRWSKLNDDLKSNYTSRLDLLARTVPVSIKSCLTKCICDSSQCQTMLQSEYDKLIACLREADSFLPRDKPGIEKDWWTDELSSLKSDSKDIHNAWINAGRPGSGPIHQERLRVRALYKKAIRTAQRAPKQAAWNRMHTAMADKNTNEFWKSWRSVYNRNKSDLAPVVNGCSNKKDIAETF